MNKIIIDDEEADTNPKISSNIPLSMKIDGDGIEILERFRYAESSEIQQTTDHSARTNFKIHPEPLIKPNLASADASTYQYCTSIEKETPVKRPPTLSQESANSAEKRRLVNDSPQQQKQYVPITTNTVTPLREVKQLDLRSFFGKKK